MRQVLDISEVTEARKIIRSLSSGMVSNLSAFPSEINSWIIDGHLYSVNYEDCIIFIRERECVNNLFFIASDFKTASKRIKDAIEDMSNDVAPLILEEVDRAEMSSIDFPVTMTLRRMSRTGETEYKSTRPDGIIDISEKEAPIVRDILIKNFNPICENIPDEKEIEAIIDAGHAKAFVHDTKIMGIMLCDRDKSTIHLRYWWVSPDIRNAGVGSKLLNEFFRLGAGSQRQILWVDVENINAINRYEHYGFKKEPLFDHIHVLKY